MRNFKRLIALPYLLLFPFHAIATGIPVVDVTAIAQMVQEMDKMIEQIKNQEAQISNQKQLYGSMSGSRGLGSIAQDPSLRNYMPDDWQSTYNAMRTNGYSGLTDDAKVIRDDNKIFDSCISLAGTEKMVCDRQSIKAAQDKAYAISAYNKGKQHVSQIESLRMAIDSTQDQKSINELQARISTETAALENEQTKLHMYQLSAEADDRLILQQRREISARNYAKRGSVPLTPMDF